jgi:hypothetical protein
MNSAMHAYERLSLHQTGIVFGILLIVGHALLLFRAECAQKFLVSFPRNQKIGQIILGIGFLWFWLLIAPEGKGWVSSLAMDMTEFNAVKPWLRLLMPVLFVLVAYSIKEFLSVRALGLLGLLIAELLFRASDLKDPETRLLVPIWTYGLVICSLFWVGMPYMFRDAVTWATASQSRWKALCVGGLAYGVAVLTCAILFWKGY